MKICFKTFSFGVTLSFFIFTLRNFATASILGTPLRWVDASSSDLFLLNLEPAGIEHGEHLILCRARHQNTEWVTGKVFTKNKYFSCNIAYNGQGYEYSKYQVMIAPRGSTSWVRVERSSPLPHYAVQQGYFPRGSRAYICRTYHAADVLVAGNFNDDDGKCYYEYGIKEHSKTDNVEILVVNEYGLAIGVVQKIKQ